MLKKSITYTDYDGIQRTEDFYFNLNKAELIEMQASSSGGMEKMLQKIVRENDTKRLIEIFKDIITRSYGEKSIDGKRFIKSKEATEAFMQTEAYVELFMELATNDKSASEFINGVIPQSLAEEVKAEEQRVHLVPDSVN